ncbi:MAG: rRNA pseudouridine synthase [Clostridia bacterium]|nr:rRNA pseudouridine synthase [Clostridia bacterium]
MLQRLDKLIASQGTMSRSETTRLIRSGQVTVDGVVCRDPAAKYDGDVCCITVAGKPLDYQQFVYLMMNKPAGVLCVSRDPRVETVVDLLPPEQKRKGLFPAGRLDKDTVGLVILTDDGDFAHRMLAPKKHVSKCYHVRLDGPITQADIEAFQSGITLADGTPCRPAELRLLEGGDEPLAEIIITEGRYHQIKRMFGTRGLGVTWLKRVSIGRLQLDPRLAEGESRWLTPDECAQAFLS